MALAVNNADVQSLLLAYRNEREARLALIRQMLERDERVAAAWLFGSLGRGNGDAWSDIDIFIALADTSAEEVMVHRQAHICGQETPLLILDAPQNRPPCGAYNMALYEGQYGPHQVDWYWQPQAHAAIPAETRLLFDRVGLPRLETPPHFDYQPTPERTQAEAMTQTVNFFWVMLLIAAKYAVRKPQEAGTGLLSYPLSSLREVRAFTATTTPLPFAEDAACPNFEAKLRLMRSLADEMERQMPFVEAQGIAIPTAIVTPAHRYLALVEAVGELNLTPGPSPSALRGQERGGCNSDRGDALQLYLTFPCHGKT